MTNGKKKSPVVVPKNTDDSFPNLFTFAHCKALHIQSFYKTYVRNHVTFLKNLIRKEQAMNELQVFKNQEFGEIRTLEEEGKILFCGSDVAKALGYTNPNKAINDHCRAITKRSTPISGKIQEINFIPEGDVYRLITHSKLPAAEQFEHWVFDKVLPSIRKTGSYSVHMTDYQKMMMETRAENVRIRKAALLNRIADQYSGTFKQVLQAHATKELTGEYLLPLPEIGQRTYSAGEIGECLGISGNMVGRLAISHNLKTDQYGVWCNDKAKGHNKEVSSFRYFENVIPVMRELMQKGE